MKKTIALLLALATLCSLVLPCAAADLNQVSKLVQEKTVDAKAALLVNISNDDGDVIYFEQNARDRVYPASITKVMTALLVMEAIERGNLSLDQQVTAGVETWLGIPADGSTAEIQIGEVMTVEQLLYCLLLPSANEAANVLAQEVSGQVSSFVALMNQRATELGCVSTHFVNPHGIHDPEHYTTCYDLYLIARKAMEYDTFRKIVSTDEIVIPPTNMTSKERVYYNTNGLLTNKKYSGYVFDGCIGIKTGSTDAAGYCLLSAARREGTTLLSVVMGADTVVDIDGTHRHQFSESASLLQWGFDNFSYHSIMDSRSPVAEVRVDLAKDVDSVLIAPAESLSALLPNDVTGKSFSTSIEKEERVNAPVEAGQKLGTMTVYLQNRPYGTVDLVALEDVERSDFLARKKDVEDVLSSLWFRVGLLAVGAGILLFILRNTVFLPRRSSKVKVRKPKTAKPASYKGKR